MSRCSRCPSGAEPRGSVLISSTCSLSQSFVLPTEIALCLKIFLRTLFFQGSFLLMSHSIVGVSCLVSLVSCCLLLMFSLDIVSCHSFLLLRSIMLILYLPFQYLPFHLNVASAPTASLQTGESRYPMPSFRLSRIHNSGAKPNTG